ncbi:AAA family ATPase [Microvenator marinus]|uniref:AAA family ATPase n=1 Tax=Microvenator marinus TaxID=2600177 RepID=A0A5B8XQX1_9DELT|nr:AAA family ATPase [Microvenator marinus]QED25809.1 AAA family ATPase [Microvenator marinus]
MKVLLTGMSGVGKSTLIGEFRALGCHAVDLDSPEWSHYSAVKPGEAVEWIWRIERVSELLGDSTGDALFVGGCAANQGQVYGLLDCVVLLKAPEEVMRERLATRQGNEFGKKPEELEKIFRDKAEFEGLLEAGADLVVDTSKPLDEVIFEIANYVGIRLQDDVE